MKITKMTFFTRNRVKIVKLSLLLAAWLYAAAALAQTQQIFLVEIQFSRGQAKIGEVTNGQGYATEPEKEPEMGPYQYWLELISSSGQILDLRKFSLDPRIAEATGRAGNNLINEFSKVIALPYYSDVKLLTLYDANKNLLEQKDVSYLIPGCGDGQCGQKENYLTCAADCPAGGKDGWCNKGLISSDPDCPKTKLAADATALEQKSPVKTYVWLAAGGSAVFLIIIGLIIYIVKKRKTENL